MGRSPLACLLGIALAWVGYTCAAYTPRLRESGLMWLVGLGCGSLASLLWVYSIRQIGDARSIYLYGLAWDSAVTAVALLVPVLFFGVRFPPLAWAGILLVTAGATLVKVSLSS
jgi:drug/metabolite transporter (DMT)-like permease